MKAFFEVIFVGLSALAAFYLFASTAVNARAGGVGGRSPRDLLETARKNPFLIASAAVKALSLAIPWLHHHAAWLWLLPLALGVLQWLKTSTAKNPVATSPPAELPALAELPAPVAHHRNLTRRQRYLSR